jgi:DNA-binding Xre family transcriptional regulator
MRGRQKLLIKVKLHVRQLSEERGISRTKLSRQADITYNTVNSLWQDEAHDVMLATLIKVSRVLHVDVSELYTVMDSTD